MKIKFQRTLRPIICLIFCVGVAASGIFLTSQYFMKQGFENIYTERLNSAKSVIMRFMEDTKTRFWQEALLLSNSREIEHALLNRDLTQMKQIAEQAMQNCGASFATITDRNGIVLARGHSSRTGDDIGHSDLIKRVLSGETFVDVARLRATGLAIVAAAPIYVDERIMGVVTFGEALSNNSFVDTIKDITGFEATIFDRNQRLSTTICRNGKRATGTILESAEITSRVLEYGQIFQADTSILGRSYKTIYWPLSTNKGIVTGIFFIGIESEHIDSVITKTAVSCLFATLFISFILSMFGAFFLQVILKPLEYRAYHDQLTGIINRAGFDRQIRRLFKNGQRGALFLIDVDNFKTLNDTFGHPEGDIYLQHVGQTLSKCFRGTDLVARLGGDEFVVFSPTLVSLDIVHHKAETLLQMLEKTYSSNTQKVEVTVSIGIVVCFKDETDFERLYAQADSALYSSKETGRKKYTIREC